MRSEQRGPEVGTLKRRLRGTVKGEGEDIRREERWEG